MPESYAGKINRKLLKKQRIMRPPPDGSLRIWC